MGGDSQNPEKKTRDRERGVKIKLLREQETFITEGRGFCDVGLTKNGRMIHRWDVGHGVRCRKCKRTRLKTIERVSMFCKAFDYNFKTQKL